MNTLVSVPTNVGASARRASDALGPLASALDEIQRSLTGASASVAAFARTARFQGLGAAAHAGAGGPPAPAGGLATASRQIRQAMECLEACGAVMPAKVMRALDLLLQQFVLVPASCGEDAARRFECAAQALGAYLKAMPDSAAQSALALFPPYRDVLELVAGERVHPADLWQHGWRWVEAPAALTLPPLAVSAQLRTQVDQAVLKLVRAADPQAARAMADIGLGLAAAATRREDRVLWTIAAAFFDALGRGLLPLDVFVKRSASRTLAQFAALARGEFVVNQGLAHDLLFHCAQAQSDADAKVLFAVRHAYGLGDGQPLDDAATASDATQPPQTPPPAASHTDFEATRPFEQTKQIGELSVVIPMYNAFLNDADEWSRRLLAELGEWEIDPSQPPQDSTVGWAHALAVGAAGVGFTALAELARLLEQAVRQLQRHSAGRSPEPARTCNRVAEDIGRLLHQFAAGFLKQPDPALREELQRLLADMASGSAGALPLADPGLRLEQWGLSIEQMGAQIVRLTQQLRELDAHAQPMMEHAPHADAPAHRLRLRELTRAIGESVDQLASLQSAFERMLRDARDDLSAFRNQSLPRDASVGLRTTL